MNKEQLKKILGSINRQIDNKIDEVKLSISEVSLTDDEIVGALGNSNYLIPTHINVGDEFNCTHFKIVRVYDKYDNLISDMEPQDSHYYIESYIYTTQDDINDGIKIYVEHTMGNLEAIIMNGVVLTENEDYEYAREELDNGIGTSITLLNKITGDIELWFISPPPM